MAIGTSVISQSWIDAINAFASRELPITISETNGVTEIHAVTVIADSMYFYTVRVLDDVYETTISGYLVREMETPQSILQLHENIYRFHSGAFLR